MNDNWTSMYILGGVTCSVTGKGICAKDCRQIDSFVYSILIHVHDFSLCTTTAIFIVNNNNNEFWANSRSMMICLTYAAPLIHSWEFVTFLSLQFSLMRTWVEFRNVWDYSCGVLLGIALRLLSAWHTILNHPSH